MNDIIFTIQFDPGVLSPNRIKGRHWAVTAPLRARARAAARQAWMAAGRPKSEGPVVVNLVIYRGRVMDNDNAIAACKPIFDGIFNGQITPDDSARWVRIGEIHWRTGAKYAKCPAVTVQVKSVSR